MQCLSPQVPPLSQCCHGAISLLPCICHVHVRAGFGTSYIRMQQNHAMLLSSSGNSNALQWLSQKLCGASRQHCCRRHHNCASARRSSRYAGPASSVGLSQSSEMSSRCSSKSCSCWWRPSPSSCTRDGLVGNTESGAVQPARSQASAPQGNRLDRRCSSKCQLCSSTPSTLQVINPSSCLTHRTRQPQRSAAHLCKAGHHAAGGAAETTAATRRHLGPPPAILGEQLRHRLLAAAAAACLALRCS